MAGGGGRLTAWRGRRLGHKGASMYRTNTEKQGHAKSRFEAVLLVAAVVGAVGSAAAAPRPSGVQRYVEAEFLLRLTMEVPVEPERVFDAWTRAEILVGWFPASAQMTVTEGGEYRFGWDGWEAVWSGTYIEVDRPSRLVFTWNPPASAFPEGAYETRVTLTFEDLDGATRLQLEHSGFQGGLEMDSHLESWRGYLYNLRAFLLQQSGH